MCAAPAWPVTEDELGELAAVIHRTHRAHLRELRIEMTAGGLVLTGRAISYYGKQMAQEEVLQRGLAVAANGLTVEFPVHLVSESVYSRPNPESVRTSITTFTRAVADIRVEARHTDTPAYHDQLRDEEKILRLLAAKVQQLADKSA